MKSSIFAFSIQRDMQTDNISFVLYSFKTHKLFRPFSSLARRIIEQHFHSKNFADLCHFTSYITHPNNAYTQIFQLKLFGFSQNHKRGSNVLLHRFGIAARRIGPFNTRSIAIICIDMVVTNGGRGNKLY